MPFKTVTKNEFFDFINGKELLVDVNQMLDPPLKRYFRRRVCVAYIVMEWLRDGKTTTGDEYYEYRVRDE
jgi:hypothetical protein